MTIEYQTKIKVEGVGDYEIKMQNVVDTRTFKEKPLIPTLLSFANVQQTKAARIKRLMQYEVKVNSQRKQQNYFANS